MRLIAQEVPRISSAIHPDLGAASPTGGLAPTLSTLGPRDHRQST